ncbi:hypothetical protein HMPREF1326_00979 [Akkermansia sp. KLE1605]|nr:hypothetical protein HMPREF1326_00979 [Akkermansia sp. KLE1605]
MNMAAGSGGYGVAPCREWLENSPCLRLRARRGGGRPALRSVRLLKPCYLERTFSQ